MREAAVGRARARAGETICKVPGPVVEVGGRPCAVERSREGRHGEEGWKESEQDAARREAGVGTR